MGLIDSLFGGGKKAEAPAPAPAAPAVAAPVAAEPVALAALPPEVIAAISASIGMMMDDGSVELAVAIAAAILHSKGGGCRAVNFRRPGNVWAANGRLKIMDGRQMF